MNFKFTRFAIDHNMMFIIQNYLNESTEEILSTLYEVANTITTESLKKTRAMKLNKRCKFFYKKTKIPIFMICKSTYFENHEKFSPGTALSVMVEVRFPKKLIYVKSEQLETLASEKFEKTMGLREDTTQLADLNNPVIELPRGLKGVL